MLHELAEYRDREDVFADRAEAGRVLASMLGEYRLRDAIIMAVPNGGAPVAAEVAGELGLPLDLAVVSPITLPWDTEASYGAVTWDGVVRLNERQHFYFLLKDDVVDDGVARATERNQRRLQALRAGKPLPDLRGRPVILVDEALGVSFTIRATIEALRRAGASRIILAVPTASTLAAKEMAGIADQVYCPNLRYGQRFSVAGAYREWRRISESEVKQALRVRQYA